MITVRVKVLDYLERTPVKGAKLDLKVTVSARWWEKHGFHLPEMLKSDRKKQEPEASPEVIHTEDVIYSRSTKTDKDGLFNYSFDVNSAFNELSSNTWESKYPTDVVAFVTLNVTHLGLERTLHYGLDQDNPGGKPVGKDAIVDFDVNLDYAQVIIGHTSYDRCNVWFSRNGKISPEEKYVCVLKCQEKDWFERVIPINFNLEHQQTDTKSIEELEPDHNYSVQLVLLPESSDNHEEGLLMTRGSFRTMKAKTDKLKFLFGSCHMPTGPNSLERWEKIQDYRDHDFLLLMGEQIYEKGIEGLGNTWYERYSTRYKQFWSPVPVRQVMNSIPTYMIWDDHEIMSNWGCGIDKIDPKKDPANNDRYKAAELSYRTFQQSHNPGGFLGDLHYSFKQGPVSFFVMDNRSKRGEDPDHPVFGKKQWQDIQIWAKSKETLESDVIVFVSPVPLAYLPVNDLQRLKSQVDEDLKDAFSLSSSILGGIISGAVTGNPVGLGMGAYVGYSAGKEMNISLSDKLIQNFTNKSDFVTGLDLADQWTNAHNQVDLYNLLDILFGLANDINDLTNGSKPRAVFVLCGDTHTGSMHVIKSNMLKHKKNPLLYQVVSSPISHLPTNNKYLNNMVKQIRSGMSLIELGQSILRSTSNSPAHFDLCDSNHEGDFEAINGGLIGVRNFGRFEVEKLNEENKRIYKFQISIEGQNQGLFHNMEIDLTDPLVKVRGLEPFPQVTQINAPVPVNES